MPERDKSMVKSREITLTALTVWSGVALVAVSSFLLQQTFQQQALMRTGGSSANAPVVDFKKNYQEKYLEIIGGLLRDGQPEMPDLSAQAAMAKNKLLALTVPAEFKDVHLSSVIILTNLEQVAIEQNPTATNTDAWQRLQEIFNKFNSQL